ncbi:MAG: hypothetical protein HS126_36675 [Anaerolineales bacterium]|nr:hypothetical protein [Anaerolineales bacterium]
MKQHEAVIEVMKANGGFATFSHLYAEVLKVPGVKWGTKTPFASIRRIVQDERFFFKIRPGLWALNEFKDKLPFSESISPKAPEQKQAEFNHTYYQGLLVEIGNLKKLATFVPNQDKNKQFLNKPLAQVATVQEFYRFTYEDIVKQARTVDVTWFNERKLPNAFIEVEHSTDIHRSLLKFVELQDFYTDFVIVASEARKVEFTSKLALSAFQPIQKRVKFWDYENVSKLHANLSELLLIEQMI